MLGFGYVPDPFERRQECNIEARREEDPFQTKLTLLTFRTPEDFNGSYFCNQLDTFASNFYNPL